MPIVEQLIRTESNGTISFGNYKLSDKAKVEAFEHEADVYKVKTYFEITKLERNGMFVYESVPGTAVEEFQVRNDGVTFFVEGEKDAQLTLQLEVDTEYKVFVNKEMAGFIKTNMSGKLVASVELNDGSRVKVEIVRV